MCKIFHVHIDWQHISLMFKFVYFRWFDIDGVMSLGSEEDDAGLPATFKKAEFAVTNLKNSVVEDEETYRNDIDECVALLERCTKMASSLQLFSENESVDEVSTLSLPYMLLPALLGDLTNLMRASTPSDRVPIVEKVIIYYEDFLQRCMDYGLFEGPIPKPSSNDALSDLQGQIKARQRKVEKYKLRKENESKLAVLR